jgi:large repetitive protein
VTVTVTDSNQLMASKTYSLTIYPTLTITTTSLPGGQVGVPYTATTVAATGGITPYTWSITGLPPGLTINPTPNVISGTPTNATGSPFTVTVSVTDASGQTAHETYSLTIYPTLTITTTSLPSGEVGATYSQTLAATGGSGTGVSWTVASGSLPSPLGLSSAGVITGTPTTIGTFSFTVQVKDSLGGTSTMSLSIAVTGLAYSASSSAPITISSPGQSGTQLITVNAQNGFVGTVTLNVAVTSSPVGAIDLPTFSLGSPSLNFTAPNTLTFTGAQTTGDVTLTVLTIMQGALNRPSNRPFDRNWPLACAAVSFICFLILLSAPRPRRWGFAPLAFLLVLVAGSGLGCASSSSGSTGTPTGTTTGAYVITVTATPTPGGTPAAQTIPSTLNVQ